MLLPPFIWLKGVSATQIVKLISIHFIKLLNPFATGPRELFLCTQAGDFQFLACFAWNQMGRLNVRIKCLAYFMFKFLRKIRKGGKLCLCLMFHYVGI